ncbi:hypothetical protein O0L34_g2570 [Tuta absoluta]|nr:hypothetical protein O0L34_g2570 [Tuta absoluta]
MLRDKRPGWSIVMLGRSGRLLQIPSAAFNRDNVHTVTEFTSGLAATLSAASGLHLFNHYTMRHTTNPAHVVQRQELLKVVKPQCTDVYSRMVARRLFAQEVECACYVTIASLVGVVGGARAAQRTFRDRLAAGRRQRRACRRLPHARPAATREPPPASTMEND